MYAGLQSNNTITRNFITVIKSAGQLTRKDINNSQVKGFLILQSSTYLSKILGFFKLAIGLYVRFTGAYFIC
jgi:hypothetical protein